MSVRVADFKDIPGIIEVMKAAHAESRDFDRTTFDQEAAKQGLVRSIQRHGHTNYAGSLVLVSETDGEISGFIIGFLDEVHPFLKELKATDLFFIVQADSDPRDARTMALLLIKWAENNPKCIKVLLGATDDLCDWTRTAKLYETMGFEQCGGLFRFELKRPKLAEAS